MRLVPLARKVRKGFRATKDQLELLARKGISVQLGRKER